MRHGTLRLVLVSVLVLGAVGCKKWVLKDTLDLEPAKPLVISFDATPSQCDDHHCVLGLVNSFRKMSNVTLEEGEKAVRVYGDGRWTMFEMAEAPAEEEEEGEEDSEEEEESTELPENWRETPEKTKAEFVAEADEKYMGNATKEVASGTLVDLDGKKVLEIAPELLPSGDFYLGANGLFGAMYNGEAIGNPTRTGGFRLQR